MNSFSWQRAVVKVGSALIAPEGNECSGRYLLALARFITASREQGKEVILVSSGSVAAGRGKVSSGQYKVKVRQNPSIAEKQAMAAIGQNIMMANWQRFFDFPCAQVLLTADDLRDRTRYVNIKNTLREIINHHALPIVNENDTVAVNELKARCYYHEHLKSIYPFLNDGDRHFYAYDAKDLTHVDKLGIVSADVFDKIPVGVINKCIAAL